MTHEIWPWPISPTYTSLLHVLLALAVLSSYFEVLLCGIPASCNVLTHTPYNTLNHAYESYLSFRLRSSMTSLSLLSDGKGSLS